MAKMALHGTYSLSTFQILLQAGWDPARQTSFSFIRTVRDTSVGMEYKLWVYVLTIQSRTPSWYLFWEQENVQNSWRAERYIKFLKSLSISETFKQNVFIFLSSFTNIQTPEALTRNDIILLYILDHTQRFRANKKPCYADGTDFW